MKINPISAKEAREKTIHGDISPPPMSIKKLNKIYQSIEKESNKGNHSITVDFLSGSSKKYCYKELTKQGYNVYPYGYNSLNISWYKNGSPLGNYLKKLELDEYWGETLC